MGNLQGSRHDETSNRKSDSWWQWMKFRSVMIAMGTTVCMWIGYLFDSAAILNLCLMTPKIRSITFRSCECRKLKSSFLFYRLNRSEVKLRALYNVEMTQTAYCYFPTHIGDNGHCGRGQEVAGNWGTLHQPGSTCWVEHWSQKPWLSGKENYLPHFSPNHLWHIQKTCQSCMQPTGSESSCHLNLDTEPLLLRKGLQIDETCQWHQEHPWKMGRIWGLSGWNMESAVGLEAPCRQSGTDQRLLHPEPLEIIWGGCMVGYCEVIQMAHSLWNSLVALLKPLSHLPHRQIGYKLV